MIWFCLVHLTKSLTCINKGWKIGERGEREREGERESECVCEREREKKESERRKMRSW